MASIRSKSQNTSTRMGISKTQSHKTLETPQSYTRNLEDKFKGLLEAAPDAMVIVDKAGRIILINSQTEHLFGYAREEILGHNVEDLVPQRFHAIHPSHRDGFFAEPRVR